MEDSAIELDCGGLVGDYKDGEIFKKLEHSPPRNRLSKSWKALLRVTAILRPFRQKYRGKVYDWVQLAGHKDNFLPAPFPGYILKKASGNEDMTLKKLATDDLSAFVPRYKGYTTVNDIDYIEMEDLLAEFESPSVMDCKIGVRTYLEEELTKARSNPKPRQDMYQKMIMVDKNEPTESEHEQMAVLKPRYMIWRETMSSTSTLGFRIDGVKAFEDVYQHDVKTIKYKSDVKTVFQFFTHNNPRIQEKYLETLKSLRSTLLRSAFFKRHEIIGSSLLFVHDSHGRHGIWMIDFGKTTELGKDETSLQHDIEWIEGNREDGYLIGVNNLIKLWSELLAEEKEREAMDMKNVAKLTANAAAVSEVTQGLSSLQIPSNASTSSSSLLPAWFEMPEDDRLYQTVNYSVDAESMANNNPSSKISAVKPISQGNLPFSYRGTGTGRGLPQDALEEEDVDDGFVSSGSAQFLPDSETTGGGGGSDY